MTEFGKIYDQALEDICPAEGDRKLKEVGCYHVINDYKRVATRRVCIEHWKQVLLDAIKNDDDA